MFDQQLLLQDPAFLHFKNVDSLISYIYYLTSTKIHKNRANRSRGFSESLINLDNFNREGGYTFFDEKTVNKKMSEMWVPNVQDLPKGKNFSLLDPDRLVLSGLRQTRGSYQVDYDSKELLDLHRGKSVLKLDKYISCAIPTPDLEFVFESQGIMEYDSFLDPEFQFKHGICTHEGIISEIFSPDIKGAHYNPYIRFKSCSSGSSRSCSLLMDLVGLETKDLLNNDHDNIFLDIVCTFPSTIDKFLINPKCRSQAQHKTSKSGRSTSQLDIKPYNILDRMNICRQQFYKKLHGFFNIPHEKLLGLSSSLHVWGSEIPVLPNAHIHNIIPFMCYNKKVNRDPNFYSNINYFDIGLDTSEDYINPIFAEVDCTHRDSNKPFTSGPGQIMPKGKTGIRESDSKIVEKRIIDRDKYKKLRLHISNKLKDVVGFQQISWNSNNYPIDIDGLKELWSDIVYNEFQDIMDHYESLDIHVSWIPWYKKAKLRSALQYKIRPPVLDLDLFFKKCPGIVVSYNKLDLDKVLDYIQYQLTIAIKCSDYEKINRYESLLKKAELIFTDFSESDIYSWLQFLSTWVTDTRVYGFWKNLKKYLLDPDHELLIVEEVCPICNGVFTDTSIKVNSCKVDHILIQSQNKYLVYDLGDPGGSNYDNSQI